MDAKLFNTEDGGEIEITADGLTTTDGLETAVYLSLFGAPSDWWGNSLFDDETERYTGEFVKLRDALSATPGNLRRMEAAALADLKGIPADNITVTASLVGVDRVKLVVDIDETRLEFSENWDAMRVNIGGAVAAAPARLPEYLTGLRVLIKDGVNIAPDPAALATGGTITYSGYINQMGGSSNISASSVIYENGVTAITQGVFLEYAQSVRLNIYNGVESIELIQASDGRIIIYRNLPSPTQTQLKPIGSFAGYIFLGLVVADGRIKVYLNTDVSNNITDTLRLVYDDLEISGTQSGVGYARIRTGSSGGDATKYSAWATDTELSLETLQSWYDLGPTGDPL